MARSGRLTAARLRTLIAPGRYPDGDGLYLQVRTATQRSWLFRYETGGREHYMGLGPERDVTLAEAREAARKCRALVRAGIDPIDARRRVKAEALLTQQQHSFREVAELYVRAHEAGWSNPKHKKQWRATLVQHAYPLIGHLPIARIETGEVMRVLEPLWFDRPETASRVRGRIEAVLSYAATRGWRDKDNPARWRAHLQNLLPARAKVRAVEHHAALPWRETAAFMAELSQEAGTAARALEFLIFVAGRTSEVLNARWSEFELDGDAPTWSIPPERMKARVAHRVPLSAPAVAVLDQQLPFRDWPGGWVFPGTKHGRSLSNMACLMLLRRMGRGEFTTHGFRSGFRTWAAEQGRFPREVCEAALAHVAGDKVEQAYQRGDLFEQRRRLMDAWAAFCGGTSAPGLRVVARRPRR